MRTTKALRSRTSEVRTGIVPQVHQLHEGTDLEGVTPRFAREYGLLDGEQKLPSPNGVGVQVVMLSRFREEVRRAWVRWRYTRPC
jgi:hypothetical protein